MLITKARYSVVFDVCYGSYKEYVKYYNLLKKKKKSNIDKCYVIIFKIGNRSKEFTVEVCS